MPQDRPILLMVTVQDWGGAQAYVFGLAQEMQKRRLPVVVCARKQPDGKGELESRCREAGIAFTGLRWMARDINPMSNLLSLCELIGLFRRLRPMAIELNSTMMGVVGSWAAWLARVPRVVYVAHGWVFEEDLHFWKKKIYIWIEKISARFKHVIICLHPKDEELARHLGIKPREGLVTIPNGIDVATFEARLLDRSTARSALATPALGGVETQDFASLRADAFIVGTVANAYPPKNLINYLDICRAVHEVEPDIHFVIIGDGPLMDELRGKHHALHQDDYVYLVGRRADATTLYRVFDLFVLPSSKEGMPLTVLEAMAAHLPVIATDVGACSWMLDGAGIIVPPNDDRAMAQAIVGLAQDQERCQQLGDQAYNQVKRRFDWGTAVEQTMKCLSPTRLF